MVSSFARPFLGGGELTNAVSGRLKLGNETLATLDGHWDEKVVFKVNNWGEKIFLMGNWIQFVHILLESLISFNFKPSCPSVGRSTSICLSDIISLNDGKLQFQASIGALVLWKFPISLFFRITSWNILLCTGQEEWYDGGVVGGDPWSSGLAPAQVQQTS